ncbi:MAG: pitrilysin family protein [Roseiflexaceae bacterium]|nr:insulinase family protein [Roseiflexus sp.]MDW8214751.1 pitrilysin family protein [Roseiflexaceae bacterium]
MDATLSHTLRNGMLVLIREAHSAPLATSWLWYRVGARNETPGVTGASHWVEHMLFKGTPRIPGRDLDRLIARNGGTFNGFTAHDFTAYFETLPADRIELALQIESDRMVNALFEEEEVEHERTVILAEREGHENDPEWWLNEAVMTTAFQVHPYRNEVIGSRDDLLALTRDRLFAHYQTFYRPNNAVLVVVGDVDAPALMSRIEHYFGDLPAGPPPPPVSWREPEQHEERRVVVRRPGPAQYVQMAYHAVDCRSPDFAPLLVLDAVLSGAKSPAFGGGAQTNRSARLYRALVETRLAAYASSSFRPARDPHLFEFHAMVQEGRSAEEVERALLTEVAMLQENGPRPDEMTKVIKQMRAQIAYAQESVTNQALMLGMWEMLDRYARADTLLDEIAAVQAEDVRRVAQTYLTERRRTVGHFIPL